MEKKPRWDIFCKVVDNYGDAAVCWRLARQLAVEHGIPVRLWIDDLRPLTQLCPRVSTETGKQMIEGVEVSPWRSPFPDTEVADVVIEAFACEIPTGYLSSMSQREARPVWINLEYLSAESWIEDCHTRSSPHPRLPLEKSFFFPGFTRATGGLLRERDYTERRSHFDARACRQALGLPPKRDRELTISLFGYRNAAIGDLLRAWARSERPVSCLVPAGALLDDIAPCFGAETCHVGNTLHREALTLHILPFLSQADYDRLLWLCELNFVRGEDSFVRAQWAERPLVWQAYPQDDEAHRAKIAAFLDRYLLELPPEARAATCAFWEAWNGKGDTTAQWEPFEKVLPLLTRHAHTWAARIAATGDLTGNLLAFVHKRLA